MRILLHQCCAPCSIYPLDRLLSGGFEVFGYFYNPNIHPFTEFKKRLDTLAEYNAKLGINYYIDENYGLRKFIDMYNQKSVRCEGCYELRLNQVAEYAKENGFDTFTSSLLYSRRQNHELIINVCEKAAKENKLQFWYEDYRKGWQIGIDLSKKEGMYRQNYCGCIFSEEERYLSNKTK